MVVVVVVVVLAGVLLLILPLLLLLSLFLKDGFDLVVIIAGGCSCRWLFG